MLRKVRIKLPQAQSGIEARMKDLYTRKDLQKAVELNEFGEKPVEAGRSLTAVPRQDANLEAEGGETAVTNLNNDGIPEQYTIKGPRHTSGGVPLKLKEDSFIFSDTRSMKIKDPNILKMFGMSAKSGGYTPAEIAKKYELNKYKKILLDPESDNIQRETAELMITNYNKKLGQLALLQESMKGYPQGIPRIAVAYLEAMNLDPNVVLGVNQQAQGQPQSMNLDQGQEEQPTQEDQGEARYGKNIISKLKSVKNNFSLNASPLRKYQGNKGSSQVGNPNNPGAEGYENMSILSTQNLVDAEREKRMREQESAMSLQEPDPMFKTSIEGKEKKRNPFRADAILSGGNLLVSALENRNQQGNIANAALKTNFAEAHRRGEKESEVTAFDRGYYDPNQGMIQPRSTVPAWYSDTYNTVKYGGTSGGSTRKVRIKLPKAQGGYNVPPEKDQSYADWALKSGIPIKDDWYSKNLFWDGTSFVPRLSGARPSPKQTAKEVVTSDKTTKKQNIPDNATKHDMSSADFNPSKVKVNDYVKGKDGKWRKAIGFTGGGLSGASGSGADNYKQFYGTDIDEDIAKAKAILEIKSKDPKSGITKSGNKYNFSPNAVNGLKLEEKELLTKIAGYHGSGKYGAKNLEFGKQYENKYGMWGYVDPELLEYQHWKSRKENWNKSPNDFNALSTEARKANRVQYLKKLEYTDDELKSLSDKLDDPNKLYTKDFVAKGRKKDPNTGEWTGDPNTLVARVQKHFPFDIFRPHKKDDYALGWEHADFYHEDDPSLVYEDVPEEVLSDEEKAAADEELNVDNLDVQYPEQYAPFFKQDVLDTAGAFRDLVSVKKRLPWQAAWNLNVPTPVYYDPTRELAANAEMANIGTQGAQMFTGPQAYNARFSQIQGQAAKNAADILSRYNNLNVGIANQFQLQKAELLNQDEMNRANAATNLFDKTTIANEMYDSQKNMARQNLRSAYRNAITNRANAQVLNSLYPQYHIDPASGGFLDFMGGRDLDQYETETDVLAKMDNLRYLHPGWNDDVYRRVAMGTAGTDQESNDAYMQQYMNMMSGAGQNEQDT